MITLAIESSSPAGSICLLNKDQKLELFPFKTNESFGQSIFPAIQNLLKNHGIKLCDIGLIAVNKGPGSYTGIRVGITAANTLSWANQIPIIGISSLQCMLNTNSITGKNIAISYASQEDCFTAACYMNKNGEKDPQKDQRKTWSEIKDSITTDDHIIYFSAKGNKPDWIKNEILWSPNAEFIGKSAFALFNTIQEKEFGTVIPNYLKEFEVTAKKAKT